MSDQNINDTRNIDPSLGGTLFQRYFTGRHEASTVAPQTLFMTADYVNLIGFETSEGLLLVDTGMVAAGPRVFEEHLAAERSRQKRHQSFNVYSLEEFGVSEADLARKLGPILERFGFRPEDVPRDRTREML